MNLPSLKQIAIRHHELGWTGTVLQTDDLLQLIALAEVGQQAPELARRALLALLDHDVELCRNFIHQIKPLPPLSLPGRGAGGEGPTKGQNP